MRIRITTTTVVILIAVAYNAYAQYTDSTHYYVRLSSTGSINTTDQSKTYLFSNLLKLGVKRKDISLNAANSWLYGEQQHALTNNDYSSTVTIDLFKTLPHFYYWGLATYTSSYSLEINNQYQAGAGIAYSIFDTKTMYLNFSDGILYENSDIYLPDSVRDLYHTYRNSFRLSLRFVLWNVITLSSTDFYQNSFSSGTDYVIKSSTSVGVKVKKWFSLSTSFIYNRFNRTQKENTLFSYGITLEKYF